MSRKSRGLQVLSLALLAVAGLMAFMAAGAQASEKSWLVEGKDITANQLVLVKPHTTSLILNVPEELKLEVLCTKAAGKDLLLLTGTTNAEGEIEFSGCKIFQNGTEKTSCNKKVTGTTVEGLLEPIIASGKAHLVLIGTKNEILFEPKAVGGNFAQIKFDPPCALPEVNNVKGTLLAECLKASNLEAVDCKQEEKVHLLKQVITAEDKLTYGTKPATLEGVLAAELSSGKTWAGHV